MQSHIIPPHRHFSAYDKFSSHKLRFFSYRILTNYEKFGYLRNAISGTKLKKSKKIKKSQKMIEMFIKM